MSDPLSNLSHFLQIILSDFLKVMASDQSNAETGEVKSCIFIVSSPEI